MEKEGLKNKKIIVWDHNRDLMFQRAQTYFDDKEAAKYAWGIEGSAIAHQGNAFDIIKETAVDKSLTLNNINIHSSDIFYRKEPGTPAVAAEHHCLAVEMEAFSLFANAKHLGKTAATILTVSDIIPTHEMISADQRETALLPMMELALESAVKIV